MSHSVPRSPNFENSTRKKTDKSMVEGSLERFSKGGYGNSDILQFSEIWEAWGQFPYLIILDKIVLY